jgi:hypothetical protein
MNKLNPTQKINEDIAIDSSLQKLAKEAEILSKVLDSATDVIRKLEADLKKLNANFVFKYLIYESSPNYNRGWSKMCWYLSWEKDQASNSYRLLLACFEKELVIRNSGTDDREFCETYSEPFCHSKKPFIETDLQTRLKYSEYLIPFINAFTDHLASHRISIELSLYDEIRF